jgi:rhodanese-related sulfurtransferase
MRAQDHQGTRIGVEDLLAQARSGLRRLDPTEAKRAVERGAILVDIRSESQRSRDGLLPDARWVPRNVLEWRLDPSCPDRGPELAQRERLLIVVCDGGYQSSLAAATINRFGVPATDLVGGFRAWRAAGMAVEAVQSPD